ncbi:sensor domain-containing phosphodiesterase [Mycolicibacterium sediminis]|uniref:EAL domain-containing protein n=1 Tax=Mycolicibacterium sediminis TaxID=1286180 RepID=A0A7I7QJ66_9MYCO|nr:EAL domain-containing protein [Mycolicibacterium sediminis]BBY26170.1 hypothetical protein MSEDJ_02660 [Mycolicibacterium sediminis]
MTAGLGDAARGVGLQTVFQPIVTLPSQEIIGYEALARWPAHPRLSPSAVFAHAQSEGLLADLDALCIDRAASMAFDGESTPGMLLAINAEPAVGPGGDPSDALAKAAHEFAVVIELTERGLLSHPHAMLRKVAALRADGFAIALDDVGAHADSLALLDVLSPEIIKLDMALIQGQPDGSQARTLAAVMAHHERTGSIIVAEGIETDEHLEQALAYGAELGQGYRFGVPSALEFQSARWSGPTSQAPAKLPATPSIFELVTDGLPKRVVRKDTLLAFTRQIERLAGAADSPPMILTTLQHVRYFSGATEATYRRLAETSPLVAVFGQLVPEDIHPRIRGVDLVAGDPLCREWALVILGPDCSAALIAREWDEPDSSEDDGDRRFDMAMTFDRSRVTLAARMLLDHMP